MTGKMKLRTQILLVNAGILAGLVWEYFRGTRILAILVTGVLLLLMANIIFLVRLQRPKNLS